MARNWLSRSQRVRSLGRGAVAWLRTPQPKTGYRSDDADTRRAQSDLEAIRLRFPDHA